MAYLISEEGRELLEDVKKFCDAEVRRQCRQFDDSGEWPREIYEKAFAMGYQTLGVPAEYGGLGLCAVDTAALLEQMAVADAGFAVTMAAGNLGLQPLLIAGSETLKQLACEKVMEGGLGAFCLTEPQAGSDAGAITTSAVEKNGSYVLNGRKTFVTNGPVASFYSVAAVTQKERGIKGISLFFVDADTPGICTENHENKMGIRTSATCDVVFENCVVSKDCLIGAEGKGFEIAMKTLDAARIWMGCVATGIAQRGLEEAVAYGQTRHQFGKTILKNQALRFKIADMAMKTETARQMVAYALTRMENGLSFTAEAAMAKCYSADIAMEVASEAIQIFGGYGYSKEYPVEKLLRDAKIFQIFEGTNEIQRIVIANHIIENQIGGR